MDEGEIQVLDCPAEQMWADVSTKPLQGLAFKRMRAELMNCSVNYEESEAGETTQHTMSLPKGGLKPLQAPQECVGSSASSMRATDR